MGATPSGSDTRPVRSELVRSTQPNPSPRPRPAPLGPPLRGPSRGGVAAAAQRWRRSVQTARERWRRRASLGFARFLSGPARPGLRERCGPGRQWTGVWAVRGLPAADLRCRACGRFSALAARMAVRTERLETRPGRAEPAGPAVTVVPPALPCSTSAARPPPPPRRRPGGCRRRGAPRAPHAAPPSPRSSVNFERLVQLSCLTGSVSSRFFP
jgi:hypothetical protein